MIRIRITYEKGEGMRYTGNLDMQMVWERTIRRAGLPLAYSQGFHPQPRIQQACPLPLGFLSLDEIVDVWLEMEEPDLECIRTAIQKASPASMIITRINLVDLRSPTLQTRVLSSLYQVTLLEPMPEADLETKIFSIQQAVTLPRERRGKTYDLRPLIEKLEVNSSIPQSFMVQLAAREGATGRPEEVLLVMGMDPFSTRITRMKTILMEVEI